MPFPKLYTDEDVDPLLAHVLREKGFDVVSCHDTKQFGLSDQEQLRYATAHQRVLLTHNIRDYCKIATEWAEKLQTHGGIILARQTVFSVLLNAVIKLLGSNLNQNIENRLIWLKT